MDLWSSTVMLLLGIVPVLCHCPEHVMIYNQDLDTCYFFSDNENVNWSTANKRCKKKGGSLLIIRSEAEEDWVSSILKPRLRYKTSDSTQQWWIGLTVCEGQWLWVNGTEANTDQLLWHLDQPDLYTNACVVFRQVLLDDIRCSRRLDYICQVPPLLGPGTDVTTSSPPLPEQADDKFTKRIIFIAIIGGVALLAIIAIVAVVCLSVRVRRLRKSYKRQESFQASFTEHTGTSERAPQTMPRPDNSKQQPRFIIGQSHSYAEPEPQDNYEKLNHYPNRYLELVH